jgi:hypothetical protein
MTVVDRRATLGALLAVGVGGGAAAAAATSPVIKAVPGEPVLGLASYDLKTLGYVVEEYFLSGSAQSYRLLGAASADGRWDATPATSADYVTRVVVARPADPRRFNGTAVAEWLNVTGGLDAAPDWSYTHRELLRSGYAYVGVSAQKVGVEGGPSMGGQGLGLKRMKPDRYGGLSHPGDTFAFDIYSQAGRAIRDGKVLGSLRARRVLAIGESQSAIFLTTYVNAIDPLARVYDGFFVHSRFGSAPLPEGAAMRGGAGPRAPDGVKFRPDLRVPVMTLITETDLIGTGLSGYWAASQDDTGKLRIWEIPGAAHADVYVFQVAGNDSGVTPIDKLAALWTPSATTIVGKLAKPMNAAPQHLYVAQAALSALEAWVRTGRAPPKAPRLTLASGPAGAPPQLALDELGNAEGGIRTPWVDAPVARLSGFGNAGSPFAGLLGVTEAFDAPTLKRLYPGGKAEYLRKFDASLARAVAAGFILPDDRAEARALAAAMFPGGGA